MTTIGQFSLLIAFALSLYIIIAYWIAAKSENERLRASCENSVYALTGLLILSSAALLYAFISRDFSIEYVVHYSNRDLSLFYTISAFWAGQKGSLLLWTIVLSIFSTIVSIQNRHKNRELIPYVMIILHAVLAFFIFLMDFSTNPFEKSFETPADGHGLNPMLQNPAMMFHPPTLYLGYVGFTVPFAFAMAALITGRLSDIWIRTTRKWTLLSWFFLSMGNLLGAQWAYVELGWGGYWAWDPVENASFMPWLVGTAYLHSVMIQEKKDMLKVWNMALILLTFSLTIFGTFITRSGLIQSVHAFGETTLGYYFLAFLFVTIAFSTYWIIKRLPLLKSKNELDSFVSRESSFLFNNLFLVGIAFATIWGTLFPIISEAVRGVKITVGPPFYNQVNVPIGLALMFLMGVCPLISWRKATLVNLQKNFLLPFSIAAVTGVVLYPSIGKGHFMAWLTFTLSIFVLLTIIVEFYRGTVARSQTTGETPFTSFFTLIARNKRRYGGYIIHIGIVLMFIGIAGSSSYVTEVQQTVKKGESIIIKDYKLTYQGLHEVRPNPGQISVVANLTVQKNGKLIWEAEPQRDFYPKTGQQSSSEVDIRSTLKEDLYVILAAYDEENNAATFKVLINPLTKWLWIGGVILGFGTLICM
ncbi:MAG: heme lyase CcmF/NrfE family subunit, partial [Nitrospinota bacterium]